MILLVLAVALVQAAAPPHAGVPPGALEGRPRPEHPSPLQARVDAARPGDRLVIAAGTYEGDLVVDKSIALVADGRVRVLGSGAGSVVRVLAPGVEIAGLEIDGRGGGDLGRDASGIHVAAARARISRCRISNALFGIYLREAHGAVVEHCTIDGMPGRDPGEVGSGIHVWNTVSVRRATSVSGERLPTKLLPSKRCPPEGS